MIGRASGADGATVALSRILGGGGRGRLRGQGFMRSREIECSSLMTGGEDGRNVISRPRTTKWARRERATAAPPTRRRRLCPAVASILPIAAAPTCVRPQVADAAKRISRARARQSEGFVAELR